jgi:hypothetical protein
MAPLTRIAAEFRAFIGTSIPQIIDLLEDDSEILRCESEDALLKLSEHGM